MKKLLLFLLTGSLAVTTYAQELSIHYLGNMGVLLQCGESSIAIDAVHDYYQEDYMYPDTLMIYDLFNKGGKLIPPEELWITHYHDDHMDGDLVNQFLKENPGADVKGNKQVIKKLGKDINVLPDQESWITKSGFKVKSINLDHTYDARHAAVLNNAYIVQMCGQAIIHLGDASWSEKNIMALGSAKEGKVDIAVVPFWMAGDKLSIGKLKEILNPDEVIITHISPVNDWVDEDEVKKFLPKAIFFTTPGQVVRF